MESLSKKHPRTITLLLLIITLIYCRSIGKNLIHTFSDSLDRIDNTEIISVPAVDEEATGSKKINSISSYCFRKLEGLVRQKSIFVGS